MFLEKFVSLGLPTRLVLGFKGLARVLIGFFRESELLVLPLFLLIRSKSLIYVVYLLDFDFDLVLTFLILLNAEFPSCEDFYE